MYALVLVGPGVVGYIDSSATMGFPHSGPDLEIPGLPSAIQAITFGALRALFR